MWIGEFGNDCGSLANFGQDPSSAVGNAATGVWWNNLQAWVTDNDIDWCWWALNPTHGKATTPVTNKLQYDWGDREPYGLLTEDWRGVANPSGAEDAPVDDHAEDRPRRQPAGDP